MALRFLPTRVGLGDVTPSTQQLCIRTLISTTSAPHSLQNQTHHLEDVLLSNRRASGSSASSTQSSASGRFPSQLFGNGEGHFRSFASQAKRPNPQASSASAASPPTPTADLTVAPRPLRAVTTNYHWTADLRRHGDPGSARYTGPVPLPAALCADIAPVLISDPWRRSEDAAIRRNDAQLCVAWLKKHGGPDGKSADQVLVGLRAEATQAAVSGQASGSLQPRFISSAVYVRSLLERLRLGRFLQGK